MNPPSPTCRPLRIETLALCALSRAERRNLSRLAAVVLRQPPVLALCLAGARAFLKARTEPAACRALPERLVTIDRITRHP